MRRLIVFLMLALLLPSAVFAQDSRLKLDLDKDTFLNINDLGFRLYYPKGWTFDNTNGITLVEDPADVAPLIDTDVTTQPTGLAIRVLGIPAETIDGYDDLSLDDAVQQILQTSGIHETERVEVPVMTRRSISVFGDDPNGRAGIITVWKQPDYLVVAAFTGPDMNTMIDLAYSWGVIIGGIEPVGAMDLGDSTLDVPDAGLIVGYPDGWVVNPQNPATRFELKSDLKGDLPKGLIMGALSRSLKSLKLDADATVDDVIDANPDILSFKEPVKRAEFVILGQPAITLSGQADDGSDLWGLATVFVKNGQAVFLVAAAPTEQALTDFTPTWLAVLHSVQDTNA